MPKGGWEASPRQDYVQLEHRRSYLTCKVCDSGTLTSKSVFRMSGPAVAIGFILLIPSIAGMIFSGLILVGAFSYQGNGSRVTMPVQNASFQSAFDANFRQSCAKSFMQRSAAAGISASLPLAERYCECALSTFKQTSSETIAAHACFDRANDGTLDTLGPGVDDFYSGNTASEGHAGEGDSLFRVIGSVSAVALGVASFVGGLLGWLLVMRKRVLQCDTCGAVVSAS